MAPTASMSRSKLALVNVGPKDPFPPEFITRLKQVDAEESSKTSEQLRKRPKTGPQAPEVYEVAQETLTFWRPCSDTDMVDGKALMPMQAHRFMDITFSSNRHDPRRCSFVFNRSDMAPAYGITIAIDDEEAKNIELMARFVGPKAESPFVHGALWISFDVGFSRKGNDFKLALVMRLMWNETSSPSQALREGSRRKDSADVLDRYFPRGWMLPDGGGRQAWSPMDFYSAAHVPDKTDLTAQSIVEESIVTTLYPYQKRTLQWLLRREGAAWRPGHGVYPSEVGDTFASRVFQDLDVPLGRSIHVNTLTHVITTDLRPFCRAEREHVLGGILCEEMGLGKTLEMITLIGIHPRRLDKDHTLLRPRPSGATLIVVPESLRLQWQSEIARHAPGMSVVFYPGCNGKTSREDEQEWIDKFCSHQVVLTTYSCLGSELHYVLGPPERAMRNEPKYRRPESPLVQVEWWRVCLDEAQMIESSVSSTAEVANALVRVNSWAITGTPVRRNIDDLRGLLIFLQIYPYSSSRAIWNDMVHKNKSLLRALFNKFALRHTKGMVRDEINLPPQKRHVINVPFTAVEEQHYQSLFQEMTLACGLDLRGNPTRDDWSMEEFEPAMSTWLNRLRQTALHPDVGSQNRQALGRARSGALRTVEDVLEAMMEQTGIVLRSEQRARFSTLLDLGQLFENGPRVKEALEIWEGVAREITDMVDQARAQADIVLANARAEAASSSKTDIREPQSVGVGDEEVETNLATQPKVSEHRRRLRAALEIQHRAVFLCANAYYQLRDNTDVEAGSDEAKRLQSLEEAGYERAKLIRREILQESSGKATRLIERIRQRADTQDFVTIPKLVAPDESGIGTNRIVAQLGDLYGVLNEQADLLDGMREKLVEIVTRPLLDQEEELETKGDEFEAAAKAQDELMAIIQAVRAVGTDRHDALSGQQNRLVQQEVATARSLARDGQGPAPQLVLTLLAQRDEAKPDEALGSLRGALTDLRAFISARNHVVTAASETSDDNAKKSGNEKSHEEKSARTKSVVLEREIAVRLQKDTQAQLTTQMRVSNQLESEVELFTATMNARLEYFRQLQAVSDSLVPCVEEAAGDKERREARLRHAEEQQLAKITSTEAKQRYLAHLQTSGKSSNEPRICTVCQDTFTIGVLTVCGHQFCKDCMRMWWQANHNCPVCKRKLKASNMHDITLKPQELRMHDADPAQAGSSSSNARAAARTDGIYTEFDPSKLAEIQAIELDVSFTTKVDAIVRHLLWLRQSDPGTKSVIFSQYQDFLNVLQQAFARYKIGFSSIWQAHGTARFTQDPSVECFLLHARSHSSGLNLVNASHVFLCEPILNTAIELQAVARIDRIGQQAQTTVWLYLVSGTVEECIYNLSVERRLQHVTKQSDGGRGPTGDETVGGQADDDDDEDASGGHSRRGKAIATDAELDAANTFELEHAATSKLMSTKTTFGESVPSRDLWACLFANRQGAEADAARARGGPLETEMVMSFLAGEAAAQRRSGIEAVSAAGAGI